MLVLIFKINLEIAIIKAIWTDTWRGKRHIMKLKYLIDEDFINYSKPAMFIGFPKCSFKCDIESGQKICQNSHLATLPNIEISKEKIVQRYIDNPITKAVVVGGLEPLDTFTELFDLIKTFREKTLDDIVIYTGYTETEKYDEVYLGLGHFSNIYVKFGRYIPNQESHYDKVLGVKLASDNQYGVKIS